MSASETIRRSMDRLSAHASVEDVLVFCEECARIGDPTAAVTFLKETERADPGLVAAQMSAVTEELKKLPSYGLHEGPRNLFFQACMRVRERQRQQ